jgi:hypothetical protein
LQTNLKVVEYLHGNKYNLMLEGERGGEQRKETELKKGQKVRISFVVHLLKIAEHHETSELRQP